MSLKRERTHHINRIKGLLASQGVVMPMKADFLEQLKAVHLWDGSSLPAALNMRLLRKYERYEKVKSKCAN